MVAYYSLKMVIQDELKGIYYDVRNIIFRTCTA